MPAVAYNKPQNIWPRSRSKYSCPPRFRACNNNIGNSTNLTSLTQSDTIQHVEIDQFIVMRNGKMMDGKLVMNMAIPRPSYKRNNDIDHGYIMNMNMHNINNNNNKNEIVRRKQHRQRQKSRSKTKSKSRLKIGPTPPRLQQQRRNKKRAATYAKRNNLPIPPKRLPPSPPKQILSPNITGKYEFDINNASNMERMEYYNHKYYNNVEIQQNPSVIDANPIYSLQMHPLQTPSSPQMPIESCYEYYLTNSIKGLGIHPLQNIQCTM